ncbi:MAG: M16 family metallopeptidase [Microbacteriaceae bacterium]
MSIFTPRRGSQGSITTFEAEIAAPLTGTLRFGVGTRDEDPRTVGLAHLVEHLVMRGVGRVSIPHNAETASDNLAFYATGTPDRVADFLNRVSDSVGRLGETTAEELQAEIDTVATELGDDYEDTQCGPLQIRYGLSGPGLVNFGHPALSSMSLDDVRDFARTWLVASNAVLTFTGDAPAGLAVRLPDAPPVERRPAPAVQHTAIPGWTSSPAAPLSLSFEVRASVPVLFALCSMVETALMDALRRDTSLVYAVDTHMLRIDEDRTHMIFWINPTEENVERSAVLAVATLRSLATDGFDDEVFRHVIDSAENEAQFPASHEAWLDGLAVDHLRAHESMGFGEMVEATASLTNEDIQRTLAESMQTLLVTVGRPEVEEETANQFDQLGLPFLVCHARVGDGATGRELF